MRRLLFALFLLAGITPKQAVNATEHNLSLARLRASLLPLQIPLAIDTPNMDSSHSVADTFDFNFTDGITHRHRRVLGISVIERGRQVPYRENFSMIDFNRTTGFFLGLGTPGLTSIGRHDELGISGGAGYGFASKRWEYLLGGEVRLPLADVRHIEADTVVKHHLYSPPTLALGAEIHNVTSTDDAWRAGRLENAAFAFFAREDFRDYYKLAGWNGYLAFRPMHNSELRIEWRSDHYESLPQNVFYGRWGGDKVLPPNPPVAEGEMHSLVFSARREAVHTRYITTTNLFGDSVDVEQLAGRSSLLQVELGHMPGSDFGFNRYLLDTREFRPIFHGLSIDSRFRFQATTGDTIFQKMEFLGGPSSLSALYRKSIMGNRMLLLNTEVRLNLSILSAFFHSSDFNLVIYNDFAKMGMAADGESIFQGFQFSGASSILYNVGIGLGWTNGIQIGATWPTNWKDDPRWIFRLQRPF